METSRSDRREGPSDDGIDPADLSVSPSAAPTTVAAIAAAISAHEAAKDAFPEEDDSDDDSWSAERSWVFAGRYERLQDRQTRQRHSVPADPWRAAGRLDRY